MAKNADLSEYLPEAFSPSRLTEFSQCPRKFFFSTICKLPSKATLATTKGTLAHYAFEHIFEFPREERLEETCVAFVRQHWEELKGEENYTNVVALGPDAVEAMLKAAEGFVHNWYQIEKPSVFDPAGREQWVYGNVGTLPMRGIIDRLDKVVVDGVDHWCISDYKGLSLSTEMPTPRGWTTMGEVKVGDELYSPNGEVCTVVLKSGVMLRPCYRLFFSSGVSIECDNVHLWDIVVRDSDGTRREVVSAAQLAGLFEAGSEIEIPGTRALVGAESPGVSEAERFAGAKGEVSWVTRFVRAGVGQRRAVWTMLFGKEGERGPVHHITGDAVAAHALSDLACGLGGQSSVEREGNTWRVWMDVSSGVTHQLTGVVEIDSVPTQCIQVDSPDSLYLVSRAMLPTHNTGKVPEPRWQDKAFFGLDVYSVLLEEDQKAEAELVRLVYVTNGKKEDVLTKKINAATKTRTKKMVSELGGHIRVAAAKGEFRPKTGPLCNYCDYKDICPAFHPELEGLGVDEIRASVGVDISVSSGSRVVNEPIAESTAGVWAAVLREGEVQLDEGEEAAGADT